MTFKNESLKNKKNYYNFQLIKTVLKIFKIWRKFGVTTYYHKKP